VKALVQHVKERLKASFWFIPACMSLAAIGLAMYSGHLDIRVNVTSSGWLQSLLYKGGYKGALTLLSTVASSTITIAGVIFSVTMVALSLASTQFGPRLLTNFMRDPGNQLVLGTFISTFLFCLTAMGNSQRLENENFIPSVSAAFALMAAVLCMGVLIYFIHHMSTSIRAEHVINVVAIELDESMKNFFSPRRSAGSKIGSESDARLEEFNRKEGSPVPAHSTGYIQAIDEADLIEAADRENTVVKLVLRPGHFVVEGFDLAVLPPGFHIAPRLKEEIQHCFVIGKERTSEQDPEYGIYQLVEIAVRALSPGINDPFTAIGCLDRLCGLLCWIVRQPAISKYRCNRQGTLRLIVAPIATDNMLRAAFEQIRQASTRMSSVSIRLLECLNVIALSTQNKECLQSIRQQGEMTFQSSVAMPMQPGDLEDLKARYQALIAAIER